MIDDCWERLKRLWKLWNFSNTFLIERVIFICLIETVYEYVFFIFFSLSAILTEQINMDSNHSSPESLREEDINEINELASREPSFIKRYLENKCNQWRSAKVAIAILGESQ